MMLNAIKQMYANFRHYCFLRCNGGVDPRETLRAKLAESEQRVKALEEALTEIRDYDPYKNPDAKLEEIYSAAIKETESCLDCKRARENRWPPSGLCSIHYRTVTRAREAIDSVFDHNQKYEPQNIARRVLRGELK